MSKINFLIWSHILGRDIGTNHQETRMRIKFLTYTLLLLNSNLFSQTLTGIVKDEYQQPIQEVNIQNKRTDYHMHSNKKGEFTLANCSVGDRL